MMDTAPILLWFRRGDLRLSDNPALSAAVETGCPVLPVFLGDEEMERLGAAARWRLDRALAALAASIESRGGRLIFRRGPAAQALDALLAETGAKALYWNRRHEPHATRRDAPIKAALKARGIAARSFPGNLLFEPWSLRTGGGTPYRVFTPMWKAQRSRPVDAPTRAPARIPIPETWPASDNLADWRLGDGVRRGSAILSKYSEAGEGAAQDALERFLDEGLAGYAAGRDAMGASGTSGLSAFLANGEIGARQCWHAALRVQESGASRAGAEPFLRQLMWREFASHLLFHAPEMESRCWRPEWEGFGWERDEDRPEVVAWKRGRTGIRLVDAAMREMMVTGVMHNRARMVSASFLTKHLMADWRIGLRWFEEHLIDWDAANNALGWQWVAGCGPDAAPYFRVFNPDRQAEKFDPDGAYCTAWIAEGQGHPPQTARDYFEAIPKHWALRPDAPVPAPVTGLAEGRARALAAYERFRQDRPAS